MYSLCRPASQHPRIRLRRVRTFIINIHVKACMLVEDSVFSTQHSALRHSRLRILVLKFAAMSAKNYAIKRAGFKMPHFSQSLRWSEISFDAENAAIMGVYTPCYLAACRGSQKDA